MKTNAPYLHLTTRPRIARRSMMAAGSTIVLAGMLTACGGGSGSTTTPITPPATNTAVQVNMGDAPADWMLAFSMNITSMSLTGSKGDVSAVSTATPMEMTHLMGTMQPLARVSAPQGTYTGATITIGSATVMYMDPTSKLPVQTTISGPIIAAVIFSTPITVGTTPMAMGFDLDLASSVTGTAGGTLSMNPVFNVTSGMQGSGSPLDPANGCIQQMMGTVSSTSGSSFTMTSLQAAQSFTFMTNSSTTFDNISSMSGMMNGMLLIVDGALQSDGSLMATTVQSMMNSGGVMGGGIMTAVSGATTPTLTMVMQNGTGVGMKSSYFASGASVSTQSSTTYAIDKDNVDISSSSLPFTPVFDASHIYAGQSVIPIGSSGMMGAGMGGGMMGGASMGGTITASEVVLEQQGMSGTAGAAINSGSSGSFTLTLPSNSAFTTLTGATSIMVFQQTGTTVSGTSPIASGTPVHAFGLLFFDANQWKMVASRIGAS